MKKKGNVVFYILCLIVILLLILNLFGNRILNLPLSKNLIVNRFSSKEFILPSNLPVLYKFYDPCFSDNPKQFEKFKICTSIWSDCKPCADELIEWDKQIANLNENHNVSFLFYVYTSNYKIFMENIYPEMLLRCPIIIDTLNQFCTLNGIDPKDKLCNTFLLDENNKVLIIGNPLRSNEIRNLYLKILSNEYD
jgi:hypothetical protein